MFVVTTSPAISFSPTAKLLRPQTTHTAPSQSLQRVRRPLPTLLQNSLQTPRNPLHLLVLPKLYLATLLLLTKVLYVLRTEEQTLALILVRTVVLHVGFLLRPNARILYPQRFVTTPSYIGSSSLFLYVCTDIILAFSPPKTLP